MGAQRQESQGGGLRTAVCLTGLCVVVSLLTAGGALYLWRNTAAQELELQTLRRQHNDMRAWARSLMPDIKLARHTPERVKRAASTSSGVTYVRWGKKTCPAGADLVYTGTTGGSPHHEPGGGGNYVCLPHKPVFYHNAGEFNQLYYSHMYAAEYELSGAEFGTYHNHEVPCTVCYVATRSAVLMIPAEQSCYPGWTKEYNGFLVSNYFAHTNQKNYECLDYDPDTLGTNAEQFSASMLLVKVPHNDTGLSDRFFVDHPLACVVCTK